MTMNVMDVCSYCEVATESINKSIENGNYEGALIQLSAYLLEMHTRWQNNEISLKVWRETVSFYRRMVFVVNEEINNI